MKKIGIYFVSDSGPQGDPGPRGGAGRGVLGDAELLVAPLPRLRHRRGRLRLQVRKVMRIFISQRLGETRGGATSSC